MSRIHDLYLDKQAASGGIAAPVEVQTIRETQALMRIAQVVPPRPNRAAMLKQARALPWPSAGVSRTHERLVGSLTVITVIGILIMATVPLLQRWQKRQWHAFAPTWTQQSLIWVAGRAWAAENAYTAVLEYQSLPLGMRTDGAAVRRLRDEYSEMLEEGEVDGGLVYRLRSEVYPSPPRLEILLVGVSEKQAQRLQAAIAKTPNLGNPKLVDTVVFLQEQLKLPQQGGVRWDNGYYNEIQGHYFYFPDGTPTGEIESQVKHWFKQSYGKDVDIRLTTDKCGLVNSAIAPAGVIKELTGNDLQTLQLSIYPEFDPHGPWFDSEIPVTPALPGHHWVKGLRLRFSRMDGTSPESLAALTTNVDDYLKLLAASFPGGFSVVREDPQWGSMGSPIEPRWQRPGTTLYVPVTDLKELKRLAQLLEEATRRKTDKEPMLRVRAESQRVLFMDSVAGLGQGKVSQVDALCISESRQYQLEEHSIKEILLQGYPAVLPPDFSEAQVEREQQRWREYWLSRKGDMRPAPDLPPNIKDD